MGLEFEEMLERRVQEAYQRLRAREEEEKRLEKDILSLVGTGTNANLEPLKSKVLRLAELSNIDTDDTDRNLLRHSLEKAINMKPSGYGDVTCNIAIGGHVISVSYKNDPDTGSSKHLEVS